MKSAPSAALLALLLCLPAAAQKPAKPSAAENASYKEADAILADLSQRTAELKQCQGTLNTLRADLAARKKALSTPGTGKLPESYGSLIELKQARLRRLADECNEKNLSLNRDLDAAEGMIRGLEPRSSPATAARRTRLNGLRAAIATAKPAAPKKQQQP